MKKTVVVILLPVLGLMEFFVLRHDFWINVTPQYAIYPDPKQSNNYILGFGSGAKHRVVHDVITYAVVGSKCVVGLKADGHFFVADNDGLVTEFADRDTWKQKCIQDSGMPPAPLRSVSRFNDRGILALQVIVAFASLILLILVMLPKSKRRKQGGFDFEIITNENEVKPFRG